MSIDEIKGDEETRVSVDAQYRPRSSISRSAPGRILFPRTLLARPPKSGHSLGCLGGISGTIWPIMRSRSRSSTVFPAFNQAFRRRVSRSWRMFTESMSLIVTRDVAHRQTDEGGE